MADFNKAYAPQPNYADQFTANPDVPATPTNAPHPSHPYDAAFRGGVDRAKKQNTKGKRFYAN